VVESVTAAGNRVWTVESPTRLVGGSALGGPIVSVGHPVSKAMGTSSRSSGSVERAQPTKTKFEAEPNSPVALRQPPDLLLALCANFGQPASKMNQRWQHPKRGMEDALAEINTALAANWDAVDELIRAGEQSGAAWTAPRAPGKWSPSQIVEHVARGLEEATNMAAGRPSKVSRHPAVIRPIARFLFKRVLRKAAFPKGLKPTRRLIPRAVPRREGRIRLETAHQKFEEVCRRIAADGRPMTTAFVSVPVQDCVRFGELHTRHHSKQMAERQ
jgi:hypothetical protein